MWTSIFFRMMFRASRRMTGWPLKELACNPPCHGNTVPDRTCNSAPALHAPDCRILGKSLPHLSHLTCSRLLWSSPG